MQQANDSSSERRTAAALPGPPNVDHPRLTASPHADLPENPFVDLLAGPSAFAAASTTTQVNSPARSLPLTRNASATGFLPPAAESAHSFAALIHDARNLVTSLDLYGELLAMPGVLTGQFRHYAAELGTVAAATHRLLESLAIMQRREGWQTGLEPVPILPLPGLQALPSESATPSPTAFEGISPRCVSERTSVNISPAAPPAPAGTLPASPEQAADSLFPLPYPASGARWRPFVAASPVRDLAEELLGMHNLLAALAGPAITLGLSLYGGKKPVGISGDDLTRILVNLVKNAAEAMPHSGHIQIVLEEFADQLELSVADTGPGIPPADLERIFTAGYSSHVSIAPLVSQPCEANALFEPGPGCDRPAERTFPPLHPVLSSVDAPPTQEAPRTVWPSPHSGLGLTIVRSIVAGAGGSIFAQNRKGHPTKQNMPESNCTYPCEAAKPEHLGAIFCITLPITP